MGINIIAMLRLARIRVMMGSHDGTSCAIGRSPKTENSRAPWGAQGLKCAVQAGSRVQAPYLSRVLALMVPIALGALPIHLVSRSEGQGCQRRDSSTALFFPSRMEPITACCGRIETALDEDDELAN